MTEAYIRGFAEFARRKLDNGGADSLEHSLRQWRDEQSDAETVPSLRRGLDYANAGHTRPFSEVDADIQCKYRIAVDD